MLQKHLHLLTPTCLCFCLTLPSVVLLYFIDAHSQPEERSYCGRGCDGSRGNRCSWFFPKCTQTPRDSSIFKTHIPNVIVTTPPIHLTPPIPKGDRGWKYVWTVEHAHILPDKHHT